MFAHKMPCGEVPVLLIFWFTERAIADSCFSVLQLSASLQNSPCNCDVISDITAITTPPPICSTYTINSSYTKLQRVESTSLMPSSHVPTEVLAWEYYESTGLHSSKQWIGLQNEIHLWLHFCPKKGCNIGWDSENYSCTIWLIFGEYLCTFNENIYAILELWVHKGCNPTLLVKVGGGIDPATEVFPSV